jgi:cation-transporting ATPase I
MQNRLRQLLPAPAAGESDRTASARPQVLHRIAGRLRVHLPGWTGRGGHQLEDRIRRLRGVLRVEANCVTRNVLIRFQPGATDEHILLAALADMSQGTEELPEDPPPPPVLTEKQEGHFRRASIAVRGLDRDPRLARRVVEQLRRLGVRATASPLLVRVLVEYDERQTDIHEVLARVTDLELPDRPGEDRPAHPLDAGPLIQSAARSIGAGLGLTLLAIQRLTGGTARPGRVKAATLAGIIGLLRSFPFVRDGLRWLLGPNAADLLFSTTGVVTLTFASSPLGLAVTGIEGLILLSEVLARRSGWRRYEERLGGAEVAEPGAVIRLEAGERVPQPAEVIEGTGTAIGRDGLPRQISPHAHVSAGAQLYGGPFVLQLEGGQPFLPEPRPAPLAPTIYSRYNLYLGPVSLGYAALTAVLTRSVARTFEALLLVNPRTAIIGAESANITAASRALRGGVTIVGTRQDRIIRRPDVLLLDGPRVLTDGLEVASVLPLDDTLDPAEVLALASGIAAAAGSPWGNAFPRAGSAAASDATFNGMWATATVQGARYVLGPPEDTHTISEGVMLQHRGGYLLELSRDDRPLGIVALRPRLSAGIAHLLQTCKRHGTRVELLPGGAPRAAAAIAQRAGVPLAASEDAAVSPLDPVSLIRTHQQTGAFVAYVSDSAHAAPAFAACDLAIGLSWGRRTRFPARADLLAADLKAVAAVVEAGARRDQVVRDGVVFSAAANVFGAVWGFRGRPGITRASMAVYVTALGALADGWLRLRGGDRPGITLAHLTDPRPERWGRRSLAQVLRTFHTKVDGLTNKEADQRRRRLPKGVRRHEILTAVRHQANTPITLVLAGGAVVAIVLGDALDAAILGVTIAVNLVAGVWQERQVGQAAEALQRLGVATARVLRDGQALDVPASEVVPGDVLLLASGDRVAADARLLEASGLEVDEAMLTGESLPVSKGPQAGSDAGRVVLEGSGVIAGTGRAVVVAVGPQTRLGETAAALALDDNQTSPLGERLGQLLRIALPIAVGGGALAFLAGILRGHTLNSQLTLGLSTALSAVPEGLLLLAGTGQAGVARRLARRNALVRRLSAVEALGRVDVACTDKTGTLTEGRLVLRLVADTTDEALLPATLPPPLRTVLLSAALASPHPGATDAAAHLTDVAVLQAAAAAGLQNELNIPREAEAPFDPARPFHATLLRDRLCVKGAPEALVGRCVRQRDRSGDHPLDEPARGALLQRAHRLAERGLRLLLVAEGPPEGSPHDPRDLVALGFVGISDPLRPTVPEAVRRCHEAGVRVIMLTGDHPATAQAIAQEAGLLSGEADAILTATELAELQNGELDRRLEKAVVIARATPLDKLRIIESLRRRGHTVAMTGDGVNDAPALRLADVGVAMGRAGTEVARQAADVVLADDDFATLVEALVEGRGFWQNMRRGVGLLLGGNAGELGLIVSSSLMGFGAPLNTEQILLVNLITDALPALAVVLQRPEHRNLAGLAREGVTSLDKGVRTDVWRRGTATALPALAAYLTMRGAAGTEQASSVAFASIVGNQLAQTLDLGRVEGSLSRSVVGAVGASAGLLVSTLTLPPLQRLLRLQTPSPFGWAVVGLSAASAVVLSRILAAPDFHRLAEPFRLSQAPAATT